MGVGVEIALGPQVGAALLEGREPTVDGGVLLTNPVALVVGEGGVHPLEVGDEDHIGAAEALQEERTGCGLEGLLHQAGDPGEVLLRGCAVGALAIAVAKPLTPGAKETTLELPQGEDIGITQPGLEGPESIFKGLQDHIALGVEPAIELQGGEHPGGHNLLVPALLLAVTEHRDLADPIGDPLLLEPKPDLLAVGAPGVVIAVEGDAHLGLRPTKQPQARLGIGGPLLAQLQQLLVALQGQEFSEVVPAQCLRARGAEHQREGGAVLCFRESRRQLGPL